MTQPPTSHVTRPLDAFATAVVLLLCLSWGFNHVAVKLAMHDIPPLTQAAIRSAGAAVLVAVWAKLRGQPLLARDGSLVAGVVTGIGFGLEFILIYWGLSYTTATRGVLFLYLAPFFVVIGTRIFLPADRFSLWQWLGLALSFGGMLLAFGVPTSALDPRQMIGDIMIVVAAMGWAFTTLLIKSKLRGISSEKVMLYQLVVSFPMLAACAALLGERVTHMPTALAIGSMLYQTVWVVSITFVIWFALVVRYSASRLSAFTFLTPLFGVAAGHFVLNEPLNSAFAAAVGLVVAGLVLVNRAK